MKTITGCARLAAAAMAGLLVFTGAVAQPRQTAEGAQEFLQLLVRQGTTPAFAYFLRVKVNVSQQSWERRMLRGWAVYKTSSMEDEKARRVPIAKISTPDPCITVIDALKFSADDLLEVTPPDFDTGSYTFEVRRTPTFAAAMEPPHSIDWGKVVNIGRKGDAVWVDVPDPRFGETSLIFEAPNAELGDRIEYAMKFLQMSCDATAATGF